MYIHLSHLCVYINIYSTHVKFAYLIYTHQASIHLGLVLRKERRSSKVIVSGLVHDSPAKNSGLACAGDVLDALDHVRVCMCECVCA